MNKKIRFFDTMQRYGKKQITGLKRRGVEISEATKSKLLDLNIAKIKDFSQKDRHSNKNRTKRAGRRKIAMVFKTVEECKNFLKHQKVIYLLNIH